MNFIITGSGNVSHVGKDNLKNKMHKFTKQSNDEVNVLKERLASAESSLKDHNDNTIPNSKNYNSIMATIKKEDKRLTHMENEYEELERKHDAMQNDYRNIEEIRITLEHENMALKDTVNVVTKAKDDSEIRFNELDSKYRDNLGELKAVTLVSEQYQLERIDLQNELENVSSRMSELQHDVINMESDQDAFKKFLDKLSMELQEKLGEEHVSKDTEAESLEQQAEIIGREIVAHLNPCRKLQEDYESIKEDRDDLEEEIKYLKYALAARVEIQNMQVPIAQKCECSKEKEILQRDNDDYIKRIEGLEDEVNRLHQDKQQLLMSFLNLQASQRSREVSKSDMALTTDDDLSDDEDYTDDEGDTTERESSASTSNHGSTMDIVIEKNDDECNINEIRMRLTDVIKTKDRLESERIEMLGSLCKQVENNEALQAEIDDLKRNTSRSSSRPGSAISKSESYSSLSSDKCSNCTTTADEIRSYLSIIEELTEDKLRLEKTVNDLETDKEKLQNEYEHLSETNSQMESDLEYFGADRENSIKAAKEETQFLIQNMQSLEQENSVLEENLRKLREDKTEILDNLRQAEEDRFGFIRTISLISESKETAEIALEESKKENEKLRSKLEARR